MNLHLEYQNNINLIFRLSFYFQYFFVAFSMLSHLIFFERESWLGWISEKSPLWAVFADINKGSDKSPPLLLFMTLKNMRKARLMNHDEIEMKDNRQKLEEFIDEGHFQIIVPIQQNPNIIGENRLERVTRTDSEDLSITVATAITITKK